MVAYSEGATCERSLSSVTEKQLQALHQILSQHEFEEIFAGDKGAWLTWRQFHYLAVILLSWIFHFHCSALAAKASFYAVLPAFNFISDQQTMQRLERLLTSDCRASSGRSIDVYQLPYNVQRQPTAVEMLSGIHSDTLTHPPTMTFCLPVTITSSSLNS